GPTIFFRVHTPLDQTPKDQGCRGSVPYEIASPTPAAWRCEWDNAVGQKNTARANVDPQTAGFQSLAQIGQGDENVPVTFTISSGGQGPVPTTRVLQSIAISPNSPSIAGVGQQQFTATGTFSDGSTQDV